MRDARTIQETREAVAVIVEAFVAWNKANADGRVSFMEWLGFATLTPQAWDAMQNASQIPAELKDIEGLESDELVALVAHRLNFMLPTNELRRKIDKTLIAFHAAVDAAAEWTGVNPPKAQIVP